MYSASVRGYSSSSSSRQKEGSLDLLLEVRGVRGVRGVTITSEDELE